jgi:hypothetical protein
MMADKPATDTQHAEQLHINDGDFEKTVTIHDADDVNLTHASIMAMNKPNQWGKGYRRLYLLAACIFLNSTMNGRRARLHSLSLC